MSYSQHHCTLHVKGDFGLPKLAPNSPWIRRRCWDIRKWFLLNPHHRGCKRLFRNNASILAERKSHATGPHFFVIHPLSNFFSVQEILFFAVWMLALILEPYEAFSRRVSFWRKFHMSISYVKLVLILLVFNTGYVERTTKVIVTQPKKIIRRYLGTYFLFDIVTIWNILDPRSLSVSDDEQLAELYNASIYVVRILASCVRIGTLMDFLNESLANLGFHKVWRSVIGYIVKSCLYVHLWTFVIYFIPRSYHHFTLDVHFKSSWLGQSAKRQLIYGIYRSAIFKYAETFLMTFCYFFGISHTYNINVPAEQICFASLTFFGRIYTLFLVADILNLFGIVGVSQSVYENRMSIITQYMIDVELPEDMKHRVFKFCDFKFQGRYFRENQILNTLSENLRSEIFEFSAKRVVGKVAIFRKLPSYTLGALMQAMKAENYSSRDIILKIGSQSEDVHFISSGTVAIMNSRNAELCHLEDGDMYGISCLFVRNQVYGVMAVETTEVYIIHKNTLLSFLSPYPEVLIGFLNAAKWRMDRLKALDDSSYEGSIDVLGELQRGKILERFTKRMMV